MNLFLSLLTFVLLTPDEKNLKGVVTDISGEPLAGVSVILTDLDRGTLTDQNGHFSISVAESGIYRVAFRYLGFYIKEKEVEFPLDSPLRITLTEQIFGRDEIIVTTSPSGNNRSFRPTGSMSLAEIQDRSAGNIGDMLTFEPGVSVRSFGSAPSRPVIRGFDGNRVLVLENGERMGDLGETAPDHATSLDTDAAERIEIVRGPASFLYGSGAIGGVVNIFNADIPTDWTPGISGRFSGTATSVNEGGSGFGRITYGDENIAATGRISYRNSGNLRSPSGEVPDTFNEAFSGGFGVGFRNDGFRGGVAVSGLDQTYGIPEEIDDPDETVEIRLNRLNLAGYAEIDNSGYFDFTQLRFNVSRYGHKEVEVEIEPDGSVDEDIEIDFRTLNFSGSMLLIRNERPGEISGAAGASANVRMLSVGGDEGLTPNGRELNTGIFGYLDFPLSPSLSFQTGLRLDYHFLEAFANNLFEEPENPDRSALSLSGAFGLNYQTGGFETGIQLARSFRTPSIEELYTDAAHIGAGAYEIGDPNLENEVSYGLDVFGSYRTRYLALELNAFYYLINNFIYYQDTGETHQPSQLPIFVVLADDAAYSGFEADLRFSTSFGLDFNTGVDYVRAERIDDNSALPWIPPLKSRTGVSYNSGIWRTGAEVVHSFSQTRVAENEESTGAHTLVNLFAGINFDRAGRHLVTARVDNLFNESYRNHLSRVDGGAFRHPMPGRGFTLRYQYVF